MAGDVIDRNCAGTVPGSHYVNNTARNDIVLAQAARDRHMLYFHVRTLKKLSPSSGKNWMMLLLNVHNPALPAWHGYSFLINRYRKGKSLCSVEANVGGKYRWKLLGWSPIRWKGRDLELAVPRRVLHVQRAKGALRLDFKWADNIPSHAKLMDFYSDGDVAPDTRFNYRYAPR
jgi:hypothetical protein